MTQGRDEMVKRAGVLLANTKKLRFFKGQVYDGGADEYLRQLHSFLTDYIVGGEVPTTGTDSTEQTAIKE
jgi:hypothetical protein